MKLERDELDKEFNEKFPNGRMTLFQNEHNDWNAQIEFIRETQNKRKDWQKLGYNNTCGINFYQNEASLGIIDYEGYEITNQQVFTEVDEFVNESQKVGLTSVSRGIIEELKKKVTPEDKIILKVTGYIQIDNDKAGLDAHCDIEHLLYQLENAMTEENDVLPSAIDFFAIESYKFEGDLITVQSYEDRERYNLWKKNKSGQLEKVKEI